jgi:hypothetical protein
MYSFDGINWTGVVASTVPTYNAICWSPELGIFVAGGERGGGSTTLFITSSLAGRPPTAANLFDSSFNYINNTNDISRGVWNFQSFGRNVPLVTDVSIGNVTILPSQNWIDCSSTSTITLALPSAASFPGREIMVKSRSGAVNSVGSVISSLTGVTTNVILSGGNRWATLVSNGSLWVVMKGT